MSGTLLFALKDIIQEYLTTWDKLSESCNCPKKHEITRYQSKLQKDGLQIVEQQQLLLHLRLSLSLGDLRIAKADWHAQNIKVQVDYGQVAEQYVG